MGDTDMSSSGRGVRRPRVAVIIPCYEDGAFLPAAVASVRTDDNVELVVVDDYSRDSTTQRVLQRLEAAGVRVIRHERNRGVSATRMTGLEATSAPFVFPLDADDAVISGALEAMADRLEQVPEAAACFGDYIELGAEPVMRGVPSTLDAYRLAYTNEYPASALYRRAALEEVSGWKRLTEELDARSDWSLWMSLAERGARGVHLGAGRTTYLRRMHKNRLSSRGRRRHDELYRALRHAHPHLFDIIGDRRRTSSLDGFRKFAYPVAQRLRIPPMNPRLKSALDRIGIVTLRRHISEVELEQYVDVMDKAERDGERLVGGGLGARRRPGSPIHPPVIVIGSGRSGTAYVTRVLEGLGIFMGATQDANSEAFFFIRANTWLLAQAGVDWSRPEALRAGLEDEQLRAHARTYARSRLRSGGIRAYLGLRRLLRHRALARFDQPWGWKDPRNTFTLPLWLDLFPDAKVVCVHRHGVDVAASLWAQQQGPRRIRFLATAAAKRRFHLPTILREFRVWRRSDGQFPRTTRFTSIEEGLELWQTYVEEAKRHVQDLGDQALEIRFEDLLAEPERHIRLLAEFCGRPAPHAVVASLAAMADPSRAMAHRENPELVALARRSEPLLSAHGYPPDGGSRDLTDAGEPRPVAATG